MKANGGPKTAIELWQESHSPHSFAEWVISPEEAEHLDRYFGERPIPAELQRLAA
jgi:hypothetical protein